MTEKLTRWTEQHALLMSMGLAAALLEKSTLLMAAMASGSFLGLIIRFRGQYTPDGSLGLANSVTLLRTLATLSLLLAGSALAPEWQASLIAGLVIAGSWLVRRRRLASPFEVLFQQETGGFLLLTSSLLLFSTGRLGAWILLPGILHYLPVLLRQIARPRHTLACHPLTGSINAIATLGFAACLLPGVSNALLLMLAITSTLALTGSFLYSTTRLLSQRGQ